MRKYAYIYLVVYLSIVSIGYAQQNSKEVPKKLKQVLKKDKTNEHPYIEGKYYCHNFASQFYLQNSSLVTSLENFDLVAINREWGTIISRLAESEKLPIYYVSLSNKDHGFYHAINAYLVNPEKPNEVESYIFIEPQSDETFITPDQLYNHYKMDYNQGPGDETLHVSIGTFDKFQNNGFVYQSFTHHLYEFNLKY